MDYTDDGWSGGNFNRPAWKQLEADIEAGKVAHVIVKDMSRIGRAFEVFFLIDNAVAIANLVIVTGKSLVQCRNFIGILSHSLFHAHHDALDDQNSNEFAPFLNIMNEWYLRDLSRKQRTAIRV
mgnify:CR=1 FL=1